MNPRKIKRLFSRYPRLYPDMDELRMSPYYFSCGDGWFHLIDQLSAEIEALCDKFRLDEELPERAFPIAYRVGKSFGRLRFGVRSNNASWGFCRVHNGIDLLIQIAEDESRYTCDLCGRCYRPNADRTGREWRSSCVQCHGRESRVITAHSHEA